MEYFLLAILLLFVVVAPFVVVSLDSSDEEQRRRNDNSPRYGLYNTKLNQWLGGDASLENPYWTDYPPRGISFLECRNWKEAMGRYYQSKPHQENVEVREITAQDRNYSEGDRTPQKI